MNCVRCGTETESEDMRCAQCECSDRNAARRASVEPQTEYCVVAMAQHQLTGEGVPVVKRITRQTTIAELIEWHSRHGHFEAKERWRDDWVDFRVIPIKP